MPVTQYVRSGGRTAMSERTTNRRPMAARRLAALAAVCMMSGACDHKAAEAEAAKPPMVSVATPTEREVTQYESMTGRVDSPKDVEIRARVSGYLVKIYFAPGTEIEAGAPLF